jgi:hypothetical protein
MYRLPSCGDIKALLVKKDLFIISDTIFSPDNLAVKFPHMKEYHCWVRDMTKSYIMTLGNGQKPSHPKMTKGGRAFVRLVIFMGGLLSTLSFSWEGFCLPCHFWIGGLLSYTQ